MGYPGYSAHFLATKGADELMYALLRHLRIGADDLEVLVDEDVVRPFDGDVVDLVLTVAQLHNTVDDAPRVGGQRSFRRLIRCRSADDRSRPLSVVRGI